MALKTYNPTTPGQRQLVMVDRSALYKGKPVKKLALLSQDGRVLSAADTTLKPRPAAKRARRAATV